MTYRITYIDTSSSPTREQRVTETVRTEDYTSEHAALATGRNEAVRIHHRYGAAKAL